MVAVRFSDRRSPQPLVKKAIHLAKRFKAALQLVNIIALPHETFARVEMEGRNFLRAETDVRRRQMEPLVASARKAGVRVSTVIEQDYPAADALVRRVLKYKPDMLMAESYRQGLLARAVLSNTDWELIRHCPCPLWLSKTQRLRASGAILAAIDPFHSRSKPTDLDGVILRTAASVAGPRDELIAVHVLVPPQPLLAGDIVGPISLPLSPEERQRYEAEAQRAVARAVKPYGIAEKNQLVLFGDPSVQLPKAVRRDAARLLVMGAVSRSAVRRFFLGNTAERVIDTAGCDVLIVKPKGFRGEKRLAVGG